MYEYYRIGKVSKKKSILVTHHTPSDKGTHVLFLMYVPHTQWLTAMVLNGD